MRDDCLKWPFGKTQDNRGVVLLDGIGHSAARVMAIFAIGEPPTKEHEVSHTCGNGHLGCVNPKHLIWETKMENQRRKILDGRSMRGTKNSRSKLSESPVIALRLEQKTNPMRYADLAAKYNISTSVAHAIVKRKIWTWLN